MAKIMKVLMALAMLLMIGGANLQVG